MGKKKAGADPGIHPLQKIQEDIELHSKLIQPDLPIGRHILVLARSLWVQYPQRWWEIHHKAIGVCIVHDFMNESYDLVANTPYLVRKLGLLQDAATDVLCRGAEWFNFDDRPIRLSAALCQTHFRSVDPKTHRTLDDDDRWWPHCLKTGATTLSIDQQREAYDGEKWVQKVIAAARSEKDESFILPSGIFASRFLRDAIEPGATTSPTHSADFTSVDWFGTKYQFAKGLQAESVRVLWETWETGAPSLSEQTIGEKAGSSNDRFRLVHVFMPTIRSTGKRQYHPAWGKMIKMVSKGVFALSPR